MRQFCILICSLLLFNCGQQLKKQVDTNSFAKKVDTYLKDIIERFNIPGLSVAITRNDSVIYIKTFGVRNIDNRDSLETNNVFHWASVSKTFVATAIMQLVEQGKIDLDEKVITYLPYFKLKGESYKEITIKQMLNHTSGIENVDDYEWDNPQLDDKALERYVQSFKSDDMLFKSGTDWAYSNKAFEILGDIISKVSGMTFETYMKKNIFSPLNMTTTSFYFPEVPKSLAVSPHVWNVTVSPSKIYPYNRIHAPSSTLNSSIEEMTHWTMANLNRGRFNSNKILSSSTYNLLWTNSVNLNDKQKIGLCWYLGEQSGHNVVYHSGSDLGFKSYVLLCPDKNTSVLLVSNYENTPAKDICNSLFSLLLGKDAKTIKQSVVIPYAEILKKEGLEKANGFYKQVEQDTSKYLLSEESWIFPAYKLLERGLPEEILSIQLFKQNLKFHPNSSLAFFHLGNAYAQIGKIDSAKTYIKQSLKIDPSNAYAIDVTKMINNKNYPVKKTYQ